MGLGESGDRVSVSYAHCLPSGALVTMLDGSASGLIVGIAHIGAADVGHTYIVRLMERSSDSWKSYPYECVAIPRALLRVYGTQDLIALYEGEVQFYEESSKSPLVVKAEGVRRQLHEPHKLEFSFDDEGDIYRVTVKLVSGVWKGSYGLYQDVSEKPMYHGDLYHVMLEDRQGTLILNASMEEAGSPQHITLRAKCLGEKAEVEFEEDNEVVEVDKKSVKAAGRGLDAGDQRT